MLNNKTRSFSPGVHTALVTPFSGGRLDMNALEKLLLIQRDSKVAGVVVLGTTGESPTVDADERRRIITLAKRVLGGKKQLTVGCGSNDTKKAADAAKEAAELGADFVMTVAPYYNKPSQRGLLRHFLTVADSSPVPVVIYNVPSRTGTDVTAQTLSVLSAHPNIAACKEASTDIASVTEKLLTVPLDFFCGSDTLLYHFLCLGAKGGVCVCSNVEPDVFCRITDTYFSGDHARSKEVFTVLLPFLQALSIDVNPVPVKTLMGAAGLISPEVRLPLCAMAEEKKTALLYAAAEAGIYIK